MHHFRNVVSIIVGSDGDVMGVRQGVIGVMVMVTEDRKRSEPR